MRKILASTATCLAIMFAGSVAKAQVDLSAYADPEGFLDVQTLTCAQLANTWQGDADRLASWYSGWYNGLAKMHYTDVRKGKEVEHEVIVYCKANPEIKIIQAIDVVFKSMRERMGIKAGGALYLAYPVQISTLGGMTKNYLVSWFLPPGTITTESNAAYKAEPAASTVRQGQGLESGQSPERRRICIGSA